MLPKAQRAPDVVDTSQRIVFRGLRP